MNLRQERREDGFTTRGVLVQGSRTREESMKGQTLVLPLQPCLRLR